MMLLYSILEHKLMVQIIACLLLCILLEDLVEMMFSKDSSSQEYMMNMMFN